jgi:hypothetical protein
MSSILRWSAIPALCAAAAMLLLPPPALAAGGGRSVAHTAKQPTGLWATQLDFDDHDGTAKDVHGFPLYTHWL